MATRPPAPLLKGTNSLAGSQQNRPLVAGPGALLACNFSAGLQLAMPLPWYIKLV